MKFLVSNDDGYLSEGLSVLVEVLIHYGEVRVVAPEQNRSGASSAFTMDRPLSMRKAAHSGFYYVNGTPTDCVCLGLNVLESFKPDMVFAGINHGANLGYDTLYSGTVAAAIEAYVHDVPAVAVSLATKNNGKAHFDTAAQVLHQLMDNITKNSVTEAFLWNVNIPDIPEEKLQGVKIAHLDHHCYHQHKLTTLKTPRNETVYWMNPELYDKKGKKGTDLWTVNHDYVSITELNVDMTGDNKGTLLAQTIQKLNEKPITGA